MAADTGDWKKVKIKDIAKINSSLFKRKEDVRYINYLDTKNITENKIAAIQRIDLSRDKLPSRAKRKVAIGSILYSTVRPNQKHFGIIKGIIDDFLVSTGFCVIDVNSVIVDANFLFYVLTQQEVTDKLQGIAEQSVSTYPSIKPSDIANMEISLPPFPIQKKIATVLSALDDKIELNNKINQNLEQQAQALFKSWFIERPNLERKITKVGEFFDISIGKTPPRNETQWFDKISEGVVWVSISDMKNCGIYISSSSERLTSSAVSRYNIKIVPDNTVILSFKLTVGRVAITDGQMATNEAIAHFVTNKEKIVEYLYCYLKNFNFQIMGSTSSIATAVNSKIIKTMQFIIPEKQELDRFYNVVHPMFSKIKINQRENFYLSQLRDALLPRFMSGEIDVSRVNIDDFEKISGVSNDKNPH